MANAARGHHNVLAPKPIKVELTPLSALRAARYNPRRISRGERRKLERSIKVFGFVDPIIARREDGEVIAGHARLEAAASLGLTEVPVIFLAGLTEEQTRMLNLALNRISGEWDPLKLGRILLELGAVPDLDLSLSGFDHVEIVRNVSSFLRERKQLAGEDDAPALPKRPVTRLGDCWRLGHHAVHCGDAREAASNARDSADVLWTDPPFGIRYHGGTRRHLTIQGDDASGLPRLLSASFAQANQQLKPGARIYVCHPAGALSIIFGQEFLRAGWKLHQTLVWVKDSLVLGRSDYHYRHEPILYGYKPGTGRAGRGGPRWFGDHRQASVFEIPRPRASREHPTMKPVQLVEAQLLNSSAPGDLVLDPFLGSGSTLIACEKLGRRCTGVEIDPRYVDVVIRRWETFTGRKAVRHAP